MKNYITAIILSALCIVGGALLLVIRINTLTKEKAALQIKLNNSEKEFQKFNVGLDRIYHKVRKINHQLTPIHQEIDSVIRNASPEEKITAEKLATLLDHIADYKCE